MANVNCKENAPGIIIIDCESTTHWVGKMWASKIFMVVARRDGDRPNALFALNETFVDPLCARSLGLIYFFVCFFSPASLRTNCFEWVKWGRENEKEDVKGIRRIWRACALVYLGNFIN